jgi:1-acyl-sn-glycerol-3-phosphate acyltransferase
MAMSTDQSIDQLSGTSPDSRTRDAGPPAVPAAGAGPYRRPVWSRIVYRLLRMTVGPFLRVLGRPRVHGLRNIPPSGGVILASNHQSFLDSVFLAFVLPRHITFLAKSEYFTTPGLKGALKRAFFTASGQISVDRNNERRAAVAMRQAIDLLRQGELLGIYPEGTRSPDGRLYRGKTGVARVAVTAPAPVIPVAITGTFHILPASRRIPRLGRVEVRIGPPIDMTAYTDPSKASLRRALTDEIMQAIGKLSNQPYVDLYAQQVKAESGLDEQR